MSPVRLASVVAAGDCVVAALSSNPDGYGHYVILTHGDSWPTLGAHLRPPDGNGPRLNRNGGVRRDDSIGGLGSSGASTGPHLHVEMRRAGSRADPPRVLQS